jgi:hypothetical protein
VDERYDRWPRDPAHGNVLVEVPLEDEDAVTKDVHVARLMAPDPRDEDVTTATDPGQEKRYPVRY